MKKKDIIVMVVCLLVIGGSFYFMLAGLGGSKQKTKIGQTTETMDFTGNIDENAINKLKDRKDYGIVPMDNIGRENPFAKF